MDLLMTDTMQQNGLRAALRSWNEMVGFLF